LAQHRKLWLVRAIALRHDMSGMNKGGVWFATDKRHFAQVSTGYPSQAQPLPFLQDLDLLMQLLPQALPLRHVLQHAASTTSLCPKCLMRSLGDNMISEGIDDCGNPDAGVAPPIQTQRQTSMGDVQPNKNSLWFVHIARI